MATNPKGTKSHSSRPVERAGWREWVGLPELGVEHIKAKLDTGARSSALHAFDLEEFERDGIAWVRFSIHPWQESSEDAHTVELPIHDRRTIRSSTGHVQQRYVVRTQLRLLDQTFPVDVTLARRDSMGFRMLVGREALRRHILVDSGASYLGGKPPKQVRRRNRGVGRKKS